MRLALGVEYDGRDFYGWQFQKNLDTVQGALERALSKIADEKITTYCAGRTDAGVHALGQVIHFDTNANRNFRAWTIGANTHLPNSIVITHAQIMDETFHARFSALSRRYQYIIYNHSIRPGILFGRVAWYYHFLDIERMNQAAQFLIGELDFSSFRSSQCESTTPMRNVHFIKVIRNDNFVMVDIQANAFLHHMVRNMVGVLLQIGTGAKPAEWAKEVLEAKDRRQAGETAFAAGLYLSEVSYPERFGLVKQNKTRVIF